EAWVPRPEAARRDRVDHHPLRVGHLHPALEAACALARLALDAPPDAGRAVDRAGPAAGRAGDLPLAVGRGPRTGRAAGPARQPAVAAAGLTGHAPLAPAGAAQGDVARVAFDVLLALFPGAQVGFAQR